MPAALDALHTEGTVRVPVHGGGKLEHRAAAGLGAPPVTALFPVRGANRPVPGAKLDGRRHGVNPDESADGTEITAEAPPLVKDPDGDRQAREEDDDPGRHRRRPDHSELLVRPRPTRKKVKMIPAHQMVHVSLVATFTPPSWTSESPRKITITIKRRSGICIDG